MCIEQIPQIALSHCCCPVVRVLAPAVAADRIVAYLKGSPFSQAENREIRQDTMPIIVSQFDQGRRTRNREKEREKERDAEGSWRARDRERDSSERRGYRG